MSKDIFNELGKTLFLRGDDFDGAELAKHGLNAGIFVKVPENPPSQEFEADLYNVMGARVGSAQIEVESFFRFDGWTSEQAKTTWNEAADLLRSDRPDAYKAAFLKICTVADECTDGEDDGWQEFLSTLEDERYEAATWEERGRMHLGLRDTLLNENVFHLWDGDAQSAIEDGFIRPPRGPRPFSGPDSAWVNTLMDYAESRGLLKPLRHDSESTATSPVPGR